jgi:transposase InsO family protein
VLAIYSITITPLSGHTSGRSSYGFDNGAEESFFGTLQLESLHEHRWDTRKELALVIVDQIETGYHPSRRHSYCGMPRPIAYEQAHRLAAVAA